MRNLNDEQKTEVATLLLMIAVLYLTRSLWNYLFATMGTWGDPREYISLAINIDEFGIFGFAGRSNFFWPPLWPFILAKLNILFGIPIGNKHVLFTIQALNVYLIWGILKHARLRLGEIVVVLFLFIANPSHIIISNQFYSEHLFMLLFLCFIFMIFQITVDINGDQFLRRDESGGRNTDPGKLEKTGSTGEKCTLKNYFYSVLAGFSLGFASLTRGSGVPVIAVLFLLSVARIRRKRLFHIPVKLWFIVILFAVIPVSIWTYRNYRVTGTLIVVCSNSTENLWIGNNENAYSAWVAGDSPYRAKFKGMTEVEKYSAWRREATSYIIHYPFQTVFRMGTKIRDMFDPDLYPLYGRFMRRVGLGKFVVLTGINQVILWATLIGMVCYVIFTFIVPVGLDGHASNHFLLLIFYLVLLWITLHCITWGLARYRYPIEPFMWTLGVVGYVKLFKLRRVLLTKGVEGSSS